MRPECGVQRYKPSVPNGREVHGDYSGSYEDLLTLADNAVRYLEGNVFNVRVEPCPRFVPPPADAVPPFVPPALEPVEPFRPTGMLDYAEMVRRQERMLLLPSPGRPGVFTLSPQRLFRHLLVPIKRRRLRWTALLPQHPRTLPLRK